MNEKRIILENIGKYNNPASVDEYEKNNGYTAFKKAIEMQPDKIIDEVKKSELRGRGGAGFTFHTKGLKPFKQFPAQNLIIPEVRLKSICLKELNCYNATMFSKG